MKVLYFAIPSRTDPLEKYYGYQLTALQRIIDYNKYSINPIRIVSLSAPFLKEQIPLRNALTQELKETGCVLIDATMFGKNFQGVDYEMYSEKPQYILNRWQTENYEKNKNESE